MTEHPANYGPTLRNLEDAAELLTRITGAVPLRWPALVDALGGQPGAQSYDSQGGPGSVVVCDRHNRDIGDCLRADLLCTGHPIPARTDPTAAAAVSGDPAARDMAEFRKTARRISRDVEALVFILERYGPRKANAYEKMLTAREVTGNDDPGCFSCARLDTAEGIPKWVPSISPVLIDGEKKRLCRWCRTWFGTAGTIPPRDTLKLYHDKKRAA